MRNRCRNAASAGGLESLAGALSSGRHERYIDSPEALGGEDTIQDGNGILGHILGSKDASRQVARNAAAQTGIGEDMLKKMLPVVAAMTMGALSKQNSSTAFQIPGSDPAAGGLMGMLGQFLDPTGIHPGSSTLQSVCAPPEFLDHMSAIACVLDFGGIFPCPVLS